MHTPLKTTLASRIHQHAGRGACVAFVFGALLGAVQAQGANAASSNPATPSVAMPNAPSPSAFDHRPELAALPGVVPTAPVRLRFWGFEVYDARLWTPVGFRHSQYTQFSFALELQYLRKLEGAAIASRSIDEMRRVGSLSDAQAQSWQAAMRELFPNVGAGDRITGVNLPGEGAEFWVNGRRVGAVKDVAFARLFFGIWLSDRTSEPKMRAQLLQGLQP